MSLLGTLTVVTLDRRVYGSGQSLEEVHAGTMPISGLRPDAP